MLFFPGEGAREGVTLIHSLSTKARVHYLRIAHIPGSFFDLYRFFCLGTNNNICTGWRQRLVQMPLTGSRQRHLPPTWSDTNVRHLYRFVAPPGTDSCCGMVQVRNNYFSFFSPCPSPSPLFFFLSPTRAPPPQHLYGLLLWHGTGVQQIFFLLLPLPEPLPTLLLPLSNSSSPSPMAP
jgi:hypothetical protein